MKVFIHDTSKIYGDVHGQTTQAILVITTKNDKNVNNVPNNIIAQFYLGAVVSVSINWLKNINKYTKDDMLNYLTILIPNDIN